MTEHHDEIGTLLNLLGSFIRGITPEDAERLRNGSARLAIVEATDDSNPAIRRSANTKSRLTENDLTEVLAFLESCETREEGIRFLKERNLSSVALREVAAELKINATRSDNMERLANKIVESTIGVRLRSAAIRGEASR